MNNDSSNNFYITTAIDYATGTPHIGHAYEKIATDVIARFQRLNEKRVFFLTGTDEHGQKVFEKAEEQEQGVQEFVNTQSQKFVELTKTLNLSNDFFIRTTQDEHKQFVQQMLQKAYDNGDIYLDNYEGLYCVGCEKYYTQDELDEGDICPIHKTKCRSVKQENYFFRLSKYEDFLLKYYENNPEFLSPKHRKEEIINRVKEGLRDISISRPKESLNWGIEFPFDTTHVTYVWFDALFNYLSATQYKELQIFSNHWPANIHIIGNDIAWFHMVYWPAFLKSCGYELPNTVHAHGMVLDKDGHKMSKSLGNVIDPIVEIKNYGLDEFRFYIMSLGSFSEDCRYSHEDFEQVINNELNNDLGNLVSRVHSMSMKYLHSRIEPLREEELQEVDSTLLQQTQIRAEFEQLMISFEIHKSEQLVWSKIRELNAYINTTQPFKEENAKRREVIMQVLINALYNLAPYISIFMPQKANVLAKQLGFDLKETLNFTYLPHTIQLGEKVQLFSKIDNKVTTNDMSNKKNDEAQEKNDGINSKNANADSMNKHTATFENKRETRKQIKAILFDFDGVIVDNCETIYQANYEAYALSKEKFKDLFDGNAITGFKEAFDDSDNKRFYSLLDEATKHMQIEKNVKKELEKLSNNYHLFCITSNLKRNVDTILQNSHINSNIFDEILCGEFNSCKEFKINHVLQEYNLEKDEVIFVTDTLGDLKEANRSSVLTLAVDFGFHEIERLKKGAPYAIVSSFKQIRREVDKLEKYVYKDFLVNYTFDSQISLSQILQHPTRKNLNASVFVHGFCADLSSNKFHDWKYQLLSAGEDVVYFDFLGCGNSSPDTISISSQQEQLDFILNILSNQLGYERITLIGHSLGGLHVLNSKHKLITKKIVIAPLTHPRSREELYQTLQFSQEQIDELKSQGQTTFYNKRDEKTYTIDKKIVGEYSQISPKKLQKTAQKLQIPILVIQGGDDSVIEEEKTYSFVKELDESICKYITHPHATHLFENNTQDVNEFAYSCIKEFIEQGIVESEPQFSELRLQLGTIIEIANHPNADKLYIEQVDFGQDGVKQIVSGLKPYFTKEEMQSKQVLAVTNIESTQFRGVESQGMLLLAENEAGELSFINTQNRVENGSFIETNAESAEARQIANNNQIISVTNFFKHKLKTSKEGVEYIRADSVDILKEMHSQQKLRSEDSVYGGVR